MHEVNGCDTSSAPFGKGKKQALNIGLTSLRQIQTGNWTPISIEIFRYCYSTSHKCLLFTAFLQGMPIGTIMVGGRLDMLIRSALSLISALGFGKGGVKVS